MNRTLRRPMFRIGGSVGEGITSGLVPRQGYAGVDKDIAEKKWKYNKKNLEAKYGTFENYLSALKEINSQRVLPADITNKANTSDFLKMKPKDFGDATFGEMLEASKLIGYKPKTNVWDYIGEIGLDLASRPSSGNIIGDIATSMREPYSRYIQRKGSAAEQEYGSQADMFKTLLEAGAAASGEGKTYAHRDRYAMIKDNVEQQIKLRSELDNPETTEERRTEIINDIKVLRKAASDPEFSKAMLKFIQDDREMRHLKTMIKRQVAEKLGIDPETEFTEGEIGKNFYNEYQKRLSEILGDYAIGIPPTFESGGRVGYQMGGDVMPAAMPTDQGTAPEDTAGVTYEELRARLPQEVTDDIVRLLANSAEALEDFAMIQTEQDINIFNKKYGVNLVLPSEG